MLPAMAERLAHRGPDDAGHFTTLSRDGGMEVGLVHRRLSIIDLEGGHQPLANERRTVWVVFNGEIYNFRDLRHELEEAGHCFATASDTEVLVHGYEEWGVACLQRLRGMFAFALWDDERQRLWLARDRMGIKPLFFTEAAGGLLFASEIKALLAHPGVEAKVDEAAIYAYLRYRYVPGPATLFQGVEKLPPGCHLTWEGGTRRIERYWRPPDGTVPAATPEGDLPTTFLHHLDEAVRVRMVSDVPFGAFLSGGVDSAAVVALMARHSDLPINTFSVGFEESTYSELPHARRIAERFATAHHELVIRAEDIVDHLEELIGFRDAPVSEPSDIPFYLLARAARRQVKMVLTGEGSDELLGGYPKHVAERYAGAWQQLPRPLRTHLLAPLVQRLPYRFRRVKTAVAALDLAAAAERYPRWFGCLASEELRHLAVLPEPTEAGAAMADPPFTMDPGNTPLRRLLYFDQTSWLPDNLLERADRMTMAASLEARVPFLDHELMAWVSTLPDRWRVCGRRRKVILIEALGDILPSATLRRRKVGFRVPVNRWFRTTLRDYLLDHLTSSRSRTRHYYRLPYLEAVVADHLAGRQNHEKLLWTLLNLELWHRRYLGGVV